MRIPLTICGFHLHVADSTYNLQIPLTLRIPLRVAESATAHFNYTNVLLFLCAFHKLFRIPQVRLRIQKNRLLLERYSVLGICLWNPKQRRTSKKSSKLALSASNLILACRGVHLQCTECHSLTS